jgi:hypothetical protein
LKAEETADGQSLTSVRFGDSSVVVACDLCDIPSPHDIIVHEIAVMYEIADSQKKSDNRHVALISSSHRSKIKHRSDKKGQNAVSKMKIYIRL